MTYMVEMTGEVTFSLQFSESAYTLKCTFTYDKSAFLT